MRSRSSSPLPPVSPAVSAINKWRELDQQNSRGGIYEPHEIAKSAHRCPRSRLLDSFHRVLGYPEQAIEHLGRVCSQIPCTPQRECSSLSTCKQATQQSQLSTELVQRSCELRHPDVLKDGGLIVLMVEIRVSVVQRLRDETLGQRHLPVAVWMYATAALPICMHSCQMRKILNSDFCGRCENNNYVGGCVTCHAAEASAAGFPLCFEVSCDSLRSAADSHLLRVLYRARPKSDPLRMQCAVARCHF